MPQLTPEQIDRIAGVFGEDLRVADELEMELDEVESQMVDAGYEQCSVCGLWLDIGDFEEDSDTCVGCET